MCYDWAEITVAVFMRTILCAMQPHSEFRVQMANIERYLKTVQFTLAVVGVVNREGQVLLDERKRVSFGLGQGLLAGIGGKVSDCPESRNDTPGQALAREIDEEIGVRVPKKAGVGPSSFYLLSQTRGQLLKSGCGHLHCEQMGRRAETNRKHQARMVR